MNRPRLLDLFCGAGGAAMGYSRAGFEVVGVDIAPQKHYPFEFHQADALTFPTEGFDAIHASPPCQRYSTLRHLPWLKDKEYWDSIPPTRAFLEASGLPWVIENVEFAPLTGIVLCGTMFKLPIYRHRRFEASFLLLAPDHKRHIKVIRSGRLLGDRARQHILTQPKREIVCGDGVRRVVNDLSRVNASGRAAGLNTWGETGVGGHHGGVALKREAMRIPWMRGTELSQAIPPAYTEWIGWQLLHALAETP